MKRLSVALLGFAFLSVLAVGPVHANSIVSTDPVANSTLTESPSSVSIITGATLLDQGNTLTVTDSMGNRVDDGSITINDVAAIVGMKPLTATGVYTVSYTLLTPNDDPLTGTYTFSFTAPAAISSPTPTVVVASPSATPAATGSADKLVYAMLFAAGVVALLLLWYAYRLIAPVIAKRRKR